MRRPLLASILLLLLASPALRAGEEVQEQPDRLAALQARIEAMRALVDDLQGRLTELEEAMDREERGDLEKRRRPKPKAAPKPAEEAEPEAEAAEQPAAEAEEAGEEPAPDEPTEPGIDPAILEIVGTWQIEPEAFLASMEEMLREQMSDEGVPEEFLDALLEQMRSELEPATMEFVFDADMTWTATADLSGEEEKASGTWSREGDEVRLEQTHENGEAMDEPMEFTGTLEDGLMRLEPTGDAAEAVPFVLVLKKVDDSD